MTLVTEPDRRPRTMSLAEAAEVIGVSRTTLWRAASEGRLPFPAVQIRHTWRVSTEVLDRFLAGETFNKGGTEK